MYEFEHHFRHFDWPSPIPRSILKCATTLCCSTMHSLRMVLLVAVRQIWGLWLNHDSLYINPGIRQQSTIQDSWLPVVSTCFLRLPLLWAERMNKWCRGASGRMNIRLYFILHETFSDDAGSQSHPQRRVSFYYHQCEAFWNCFSCGSSCLKFSLSKIFFDKIYLNNVSSPHAARICSRGNFGRATSGLPS